jgi:hypothetical protein
MEGGLRYKTSQIGLLCCVLCGILTCLTKAAHAQPISNVGFQGRNLTSYNQKHIGLTEIAGAKILLQETVQHEI